MLTDIMDLVISLPKKTKKNSFMSAVGQDRASSSAASSKNANYDYLIKLLLIGDSG
jgi:hypothetical protein